MYDTKSITLGQTLREYRKISNMTLEEVGNKICKSKVSVCKYENNEILPDFYTLLELCNVLNIDINQLCEQIEEDEIKIENPFQKRKLYLYYYTKNKLIDSVMELQKQGNKYMVKFFNGIKKDSKKCAYYYEGEMINDKTITYFDLNTGKHARVNEKVQIIVNIPWAENLDVYDGLYTGMNRNGLPVVKKILVSKIQINDFEKYDNHLKFSKEESKKMYKENALVFANTEYDEFF